MRIQAWSHSRLTTYELCPYRAKLAYLDKIPEPPRPLPPGKTEHANDRGSRIHAAAELYVREPVELIPELKAFRAEFQRLRELYRQGKVSLEEDWAYTDRWTPVAWRDPKAWLRMKLDAMVRLSPTHAVVIDYKTGRRVGNEIKHAEQGQLYQLGVFMRYPDVETVDVEFWYVDQDDLSHMQFLRPQGLRFMRGFDERGHRLTAADDFPPKPSTFACRWCPYNTPEHCSYGVR